MTNVSIHLQAVLAELNHDVDTVFDEGLSGVNDVSVLHAASSQDRILFTLDTDFLNLGAYPPGSHTASSFSVHQGKVR